MFPDAYMAVILIFGIVLAAACYAVRSLKTRPARIASVITALALLIGALVPVVRILTESAAPASSTVAPAPPATPVAPTPTHEPAPVASDQAAMTPAAEQ
ncbi:hypothetical protein [Streptomyces parvulus]|uniref:Uncharacterized protein n=1 Tax=Streptomyces parvulus TaxID=146923 RepID=A0A369UTW7_9ACTN|nr:hypothetical protein [Streptomyces parvulus]RDD83897.1 hypothetical protein DVZ84_38110 [Streptomyces parvulus]